MNDRPLIIAQRLKEIHKELNQATLVAVTKYSPVEDVVMAYEVTVIPAARLPHPEKVEGSLYEHLTQIGCAPVRAIQHLRAMNADPHLAAQLRVAVGQAVLFITRVGYLENGDAVELTHSYCRSDYYDFVVELRRDSQANS